MSQNSNDFSTFFVGDFFLDAGLAFDFGPGLVFEAGPALAGLLAFAGFGVLVVFEGSELAAEKLSKNFSNWSKRGRLIGLYNPSLY